MCFAVGIVEHIVVFRIEVVCQSSVVNVAQLLHFEGDCFKAFAWTGQKRKRAVHVHAVHDQQTSRTRFYVAFVHNQEARRLKQVCVCAFC